MWGLFNLVGWLVIIFLFMVGILKIAHMIQEFIWLME